MVDRGDLERTASEIRGQIVELSHRAGTPHLASCLSCVDIIVAAYWSALRIDPQKPDDPARDRFILSKGHAAPALYVALAARGFFGQDLLDEYNEPGAVLAEQPSPRCAPGVELATGSLGHGLPVGVGMAIAGRLTDADYRVCVVMSDGECNEGTVWEAAMTAPAHGLGRLTAVVDSNGWQATGRSAEVLALEPLADKFAAFGWEASEIDGHDVVALAEALAAPPSDTPRAFIARTVKGKGVSFMEDDNNWHYRIPTAEELEAARRDLGLVPA
ncbi:MAG TPA: transketolase [Thermoleophilaceae bacterium]